MGNRFQTPQPGHEHSRDGNKAWDGFCSPFFALASAQDTGDALGSDDLCGKGTGACLVSALEVMKWGHRSQC